MAKLSMTDQEVFTKNEMKRGTSAHGQWLMCIFTGENTKDKITVFANNPEKIPECAEAVEIERITCVEISHTKSNSGVWFTNISVKADLAEVKGGAMPMENPFK